MLSTQFTKGAIQENYKYALESKHYVGLPLWDTQYPLTALQCEQAMCSSDMMNGWIRTTGKNCFCDLCARRPGECHRPTCKFTGPVGNLNNLKTTPEDDESHVPYLSCSVQ